MAGFLGSFRANGSNSGYRYSGSWQDMPSGFQNLGMGFERFMDRFGEPNVALILALVCVGILIGLVFTFLGIVGQGALVKGIWKYNEDSIRKLRFGELFKDGLHYFWKLFLLGLLTIGASIALVFVLVILSIVTLGIAAIIFACLAIPLAIGYTLLLKQTVISIVAEDMEIFDAIRHAWDFVFQKHLGNYLLMWLIAGVGGAVVNVLIALPFTVVALPVMGSLVFGGDTAVTGGLMIGLILGLAYLPFYLVLNGGTRAFIESVWTIFYRDLRSARDESSLSPMELEASLPPSGSMD
jgi:hypothetical protein